MQTTAVKEVHLSGHMSVSVHQDALKAMERLANQKHELVMLVREINVAPLDCRDSHSWR